MKTLSLIIVLVAINFLPQLIFADIPDYAAAFERLYLQIASVFIAYAWYT